MQFTRGSAWARNARRRDPLAERGQTGEVAEEVRYGGEREDFCKPLNQRPPALPTSPSDVNGLDNGRAMIPIIFASLRPLSDCRFRFFGRGYTALYANLGEPRVKLSVAAGIFRVGALHGFMSSRAFALSLIQRLLLEIFSFTLGSRARDSAVQFIFYFQPRSALPTSSRVDAAVFVGADFSLSKNRNTRTHIHTYARKRFSRDCRFVIFAQGIACC